MIWTGGKSVHLHYPANNTAAHLTACGEYGDLISEINLPPGRYSNCERCRAKLRR